MVSYVLTGKSNVTITPETRQRVLDAIKELGYLTNRNACSLRTNRTLTLALIIPDITNPFYPAFARGIQDVADQHDYDVITYNTDGIYERENKCLQSIIQRRVDGVVVVLFQTSARELFPILDMSIPVVRLEATYRNAGERSLDNLCLDNEEAAQTVVRYLIDSGHTRIGMITSNEGPANYRTAGYRTAFRASNLPVAEDRIRIDTFNEQGGYRATQALLQNDPTITAIFAANDLMALGGYQAVREMGLSIPGDISIIGFDNIPTASLVTPSLTTIDQFQQQIGRRAAEMIFERLLGTVPEKGRSEKQSFQLIIRESA